MIPLIFYFQESYTVRVVDTFKYQILQCEGILTIFIIHSYDTNLSLSLSLRSNVDSLFATENPSATLFPTASLTYLNISSHPPQKQGHQSKPLPLPSVPATAGELRPLPPPTSLPKNALFASPILTLEPRKTHAIDPSKRLSGLQGRGFLGFRALVLRLSEKLER